MNRKTVIIYASKHHGNTYRLVKAISDKYNVDVIDVMKQSDADIQEYEIVGFASGIDFGKFYEEVEKFAKDSLPPKKKVFFLYTCAMQRKEFVNSMKEIVLEKEAIILGEFGCKGYNTYGPWKLVGGMNKKHPTEKEIKMAIDFFERMQVM